MARASWRGAVIAESDRTIVIEGNHYFPPDGVDPDRMLDSPTRSWCYWKGKAHYFGLVIDGERVVPNVAWSYPKPWPLAGRIAGYVAFGSPVRVER